jgi:AGCS family alanine or glycine:cation symporter
MFAQIEKVVGDLNAILFHEYVVFALLFTGVLFTFWSAFGQYRALTHGVQVVRGKYDDKNDPGAINHFQALSTALSATVGLGNIAGVAVAVALGGPGAILWMWVIGVVGMALKMTEVTQSMLYRNTDDPENPHGGPMFVVKRGIEESLKKGKSLSIITGVVFAAVILFCGIQWGGPIAIGLCAVFGLVLVVMAFTKGAAMGSLIGGIFVVTLIVSAITGGNMFQAWNVADVTNTYFGVPQVVPGIIMTVVVGAVIIGGIKRIGAVTGRLVPFMCVMYMLAGVYVLALNIEAIPSMLVLIVKSGLPDWLGGSSASPEGAFLGGTFGYAAIWGIKRALFSSEAGQGSAPIAHSAAKTDEPVREGVVAGLEPFIDTLVVCSLTALVILSSGAYNRDAEAEFAQDSVVEVVFASEEAGTPASAPAATHADAEWTLASIPVPTRVPTKAEEEANAKKGKAVPDWKPGDAVFVRVDVAPGDRSRVVSGKVVREDGQLLVKFVPIKPNEGAPPITSLQARAPLYHGALPQWSLRSPALPRMSEDGRRIRRTPEGQSGWRDEETVFIVVEADLDSNTGRDLRRITGTVHNGEDEWTVAWNTLESEIEPFFRKMENGEDDIGIYGDYAGASMTAYAFDRVTPGLGKWLVSAAAWLFAVSTMISWSYYGEQGVVYLFARTSKATSNMAVLLYKVIYCALIILTTVAAMKIFGQGDAKHAIIGTDKQLDDWTTLGLGVMLVANIPIMLIFGATAMRSYHEYMRRFKAGEMHPHAAPPITDVAEGKDVE